MRKWFKRITAILLLSFGAFAAYVYFAGGYHTRPVLPAGAFSISFKSGLRAILLDIPDERGTRRYFGVAFDVPFWAEDAWSSCSQPTKQEASRVLSEVDLGEGSRLDAVCTIQADDTTITRGAVFSAPRL